MADELLRAEAHKVLTSAIRELSGLVNEAHRRQEYATLAALASVADGLSVLVRGLGQPQNPVQPTRVSLRPRRKGPAQRRSTSMRAIGATPLRQLRGGNFETGSSTFRTRNPGDRPLPVFQVDDDGQTLVKVGYSKSDRREYEHRSPREVLDRLTSLVTKLGAGGRRFTTEQILPPGEDQLADLPSYQVYLCLALLVRTGLLVRHGRQGYTVPEGADLKQAVDQAWSNLPKH